MKVELIANAGFVVTLADGRTIITDPWLTGGVYHGSWYNFPPVPADVRDRVLAARPTWIYVSHVHPDHLDPAVLKVFPRETPVLIGALPHQHLRRALTGLGFTNVVELPLDEPTMLDGIEVTILPQFAAAGGGFEDAVDYAMDTSLVVRDADGTVFLDLVDNAVDVATALALHERLGSPDVAILPYAGASFYPHAFAYVDQEKDERTVALRTRMTSLFLEVVAAVGPKFAIPAAGSYVMGGRLAPWTRWLHQATPEQIAEAWNEAPPPGSALRLLAPGDTLDSSTGEVDRSHSELRDFTPEARLAYAMTLADRPLAQDEVHIPPGFEIPWPRILMTARSNLWRVQCKLELFPLVDVELRIRSTPGVGANISTFTFSLNAAEAQPPAERAHIAFTVDASLLLMILVGAAVWNNAEIGALIEVERTPDVYDPTIHSLMSYFTLAG